jgi:hypothetical protein
MRKDNWPHFLNEYIFQKRNEAFEWSKNDCWQFSIGAIKAITDKDFSEVYVYETARRAAELMQENGGMMAIADKNFGQSKSIMLAQRGDVVCLTNAGRELLGVCLGEMSAFVAESGIILKPTLDCEKAWSV